MKILLLIPFALSAFGQTGGALQPVPIQQPLDNAGRTLQGQCLYTYAAGTTTPQATYSNSALSVPNTNPIIINGFGREPAVYLSAVSYKIVLAYATTPGNCPVSPGTVIWSQDNVYDFGELLKVTLAGPGGAGLIGLEQPGGNPTTVIAAFNSLGINDYAYSSLSAACSSATGTNLNLSKAWTAVPTMTCLAGAINPIFAGSVQPGSSQVFTTPCPAIVPFEVFDISVGGVNSVKFNAPCAGPIDIRMFGAPGGDWGLSLQAAYNACSNIGGCTILYPSGTFAHTTKFTLSPNVPVQIVGQGTATFISSTTAPTLLTYSGTGAFINQNPTDKTDNVMFRDFGYTCSAPGCQFIQAGSFSADDNAAWNRVGWVFTNLWLQGVDGSVSASNPGMSLTQMVKCVMNNVVVLGFYQDAVFDRTNGCALNTVWFQNYTVGPLITTQAGSGSGAGFAAEMVCSNCAFQGPNFGSGHYSVTWDHYAISCIGCLYEPTVTSLGWMHNTNQGHNFSDYFGFMSGAEPTNSFVWDSPVALTYIATNSNYVPTPPISSGSVPALNYASPATMMGVSAPLYMQCLALGNVKCQGIGGTPFSYGGYMALSGPLHVDVPTSGDMILSVLNKNGATNDVNSLNFSMPAADQTARAEIQFYAITEAAGAGSISAGAAINTGTQSSTAQTVYFGADGHVALPRYPGSGGAGGKRVLCIDSTTGILFMSSTSVDCSN